MRQTLRRSCTACAKYKHSCDLGTPRCSRCIKRRVECHYANTPLTAPYVPALRVRRPHSLTPVEGPPSIDASFAALDPFDSYPVTRLPRKHVQRLIYNFLHKIAFQYYPLDLNAASNPFLVSWWPLALGDPALFHVSLQTACLDEELLAQKGFLTSEMLMADSVALLRHKVDNAVLAVQDGTMNSVITLAAIEFGKGNLAASQMHIGGVKRLVALRNGMHAVSQTSPLTARMVSWVSMIVTGVPQFDTQDDAGIGDGIPTLSDWQIDATSLQYNVPSLDNLDIADDVRDVFTRLTYIFWNASTTAMSNTRLHDLTCFVAHRLLRSEHGSSVGEPSQISECLRVAMVLYIFMLQGPTYFSHAVMQNMLVCQLLDRLEGAMGGAPRQLWSLEVWLLGVGMAASLGTDNRHRFLERARRTASVLGFGGTGDALAVMRSILWLERLHGEGIFRQSWDEALLESI
ncbi:uncharacterized protein F5Z01DRAFT_226766 [Emericellopsis atlantica]|uniref:Zn(2)-C6 fungal-type domain-containing protein n=1 Tax=Emericellopsis atlantica TaxID=2614577 RepID=A0A9P8CMF9_9HYPO|nr:uncharacterized protein F5Z01DRAFT_226766 [Emericellopsis atlantica]KAG9252403.1 hypothetical protein F5Z01DRAFT_226766 [Emericellopsis atlantica]